MENAVQLQAKWFVTASRPQLTKDRRPLSEYEISSMRLDRELGLLPHATSEIDVEDFVESPDFLALTDGTFKVRVKLVSVTPRGERTWYEIRVGKRHRFTYASVKQAARAFNKLSADNLQPSDWISSNGGAREMPAAPKPNNLLNAIPRLLGWNLSAG